MSARTPQHVREILMAEFERRCFRNPRYSQRAFARDLGLSPPMLCELLAGKKNVSRQKAAEIATTLGLSPQETAWLCNLAAKDSDRSEFQRQRAAKAVKQIPAPSTAISLERFTSISSFLGFVILEALNLQKLVPTAKGIATRVGAPVERVRQILRELVAAGLLGKDGRRYVRPKQGNKLPGGMPSAAVRSLHDAMLERAQTALHEDSMQTRDISSLILACRKEDLEEARQFISHFREDFDARFCCRDGDGDDVYCLGVQYFRVLP